MEPRRTQRFHGGHGRISPGKLCPWFVSASTVVAFVLVSALASGCAHPQAKTVTTAAEAPLEVPAPPPRATEPITADALPPVAPPLNEPARTNAARPTRQPIPSAAPVQPRPDAPRADTAQPTPDAARPADDTAARPAAPPPPTTLQTTPAQQEPEVEARIRGVLGRAQSDLSRVDYGRLSTNAKTQYDTAKRFISQSEEQIRARNLVFAGTLADKAAELAAQLAGR